MSLLDNQRAAEGIDDLYMDLEARLMQNIVRHIQNYDQPIPTDEWLLQKLAEIGRLDRENLRIISEMAGIPQHNECLRRWPRRSRQNWSLDSSIFPDRELLVRP